MGRHIVTHSLAPMARKTKRMIPLPGNTLSLGCTSSVPQTALFFLTGHAQACLLRSGRIRCEQLLLVSSGGATLSECSNQDQSLLSVLCENSVERSRHAKWNLFFFSS
mmetsp:Transcript_107977/g.209067  ORF Transcript_107977/g.209067 Transcript_107977/m.209067 type:complete len:108 (+) Transcript_107977:63-386(+)